MDASRPFVGRRLEVELLLDRIAAAEAGTGGVVLLSGPAGIGKTRLVDEVLARRAEGAEPIAVGRGLCSDDRGAPALWPWTRALQAWQRAGGPEPSLVLEPGTRTGPIEDQPSAAAARFQMLTAATDVLLHAASHRPLVLVLEDLHWADAESLELLRRVAAESGTAALLVLATHRDALADEAAAAIADVRRGPTVATVQLGPLSEIEVGEYVRAVDPGAEAARAPALHRSTGGLPLLLATATDRAAPGDLSVVVAGMLARLGPAEREIVEVLALLGPQADTAVLEAVAGADAPTVAAGLDAGRRTGLLGPASDDGVAFAHALLQDAVRRSVDTSTAAARHRRAAEVLAERAGIDPRWAGEVAAHWRRAGGGRDADRQAASWSEVAGDQAERTLALDDAVRHLRDAADSLRAAGAEEGDVARLLVRLATAEFLAGRLSESLARCDAAGAAAERAGRPDLVAAAALVVRGVTSPPVTAVVERLGRTALAADGLPGSTRARLLAQLATCAADSSRPAEASKLAEEALRTARADGDPGALLDATRAREMTLLAPSDAPERARLGHQAMELGRTLDQPLATVIAAGWLLRGAYELARMDLVDEAFAAMEAAADSSGQPLVRWHLLRSAASRAALEGRYADARAGNLAALEIALALDDLSAIGMSYAHAGEVARTRGQPTDLLDGSGEMFASAPPMALVRSARAGMLAMLGETDEARGLYEELRVELDSMPVDVRWAPVLFHVAELAVQFEDAQAAVALEASMAPWRVSTGAVGVPTAYFAGSPLRDLGRLAATAGRLAEAEALLREAERRNLVLRARPYLALTRLDLAGVLHRTGALGEAATYVRQAADDLRRLEMPGPLRLADQLTAAISATRDRADPLSARERQIHDLVVKAMTNREIAAALVLSERTVESHVRNVLAKLGCSNRTELIARRPGG